MAVGVTGSSLGAIRQEVVLGEGECADWSGRTIRYERLVQDELPDKLVATALLRVTPASGRDYTMRPARHLHLLQNHWTTEVAIHSTWAGDFYTILNSGEGDGRVSLTFVHNPLMRFLWLGGGLMFAGAVVSLWPTLKPAAVSAVRRKPAVVVHAKRMQLVASTEPGGGF
jgi:cytochrome c-type biogenesis protein CcmF